MLKVLGKSLTATDVVCALHALNIGVASESSQLRGKMSVVIFTETLKVTFMMYFETTYLQSISCTLKPSHFSNDFFP